MKTPVSILVLLALPSLALAATIYPGERGDDVKATLGPPPDARVSSNTIIWYYSHGQVRLENDRVIDSDFSSPDGVAAQQAANAADAAQHNAEGEALKAKTDADPGFAASSPADQAAYWEDFSRRYPAVSCESELEAVRARQIIHIGDSLDAVKFALGEPRSQAVLGDKLILYYRRGQAQLVDGHVVSSDLPIDPKAGVTPGESITDVRAALGEPKSKAQSGNEEIWLYRWGRVEIKVQFIDGKVVSPGLATSSDSGAAVSQAQPAADADASALRAQHMAEGEALKAKTVADPTYAAMSPGDQLALWEDFRTSYPAVSCDNEYNAALARWQREQNRIQQQAATGQIPTER
jgi:hypothetical protein